MSALLVAGWLFIALAVVALFAGAVFSSVLMVVSPLVLGFGIAILAAYLIVEKLSEIADYLRDTANYACPCGRMTERLARQRGHVCGAADPELCACGQMTPSMAVARGHVCDSVQK